MGKWFLYYILAGFMRLHSIFAALKVAFHSRNIHVPAWLWHLGKPCLPVMNWKLFDSPCPKAQTAWYPLVFHTIVRNENCYIHSSIYYTCQLIPLVLHLFSIYSYFFLFSQEVNTNKKHNLCLKRIEKMSCSSNAQETSGTKNAFTLLT